MGDNFGAITFLLGLAIPFGWEAVTEEGWRRYGAGALAAFFFMAAVVWIPMKSAAPALAGAISSAAAHPVSWVVLLLFAAALIIFPGPQFRMARLPFQATAPSDSASYEQILDLRRETDEIRKVWLSG